MKTKISKDARLTMQLLCAFVLGLAGVGLLIAGFCAVPVGEIHNTVLVAYGETLTFVGSVFGLDYRYKQKKEENEGDK